MRDGSDKRSEEPEKGAVMTWQDENSRQIERLIDEAAAGRRKAYAPYSGYLVGAALLAEDGTVYTGCNIENAAFSPTICAERTAIAKAVSEGVREFEAICIIGGKAEEEVPSSYAAPCGSCRQVMREFCRPDRFHVILARDRDHYSVFTLDQLLPEGFGPDNLA